MAIQYAKVNHGQVVRQKIQFSMNNIILLILIVGNLNKYMYSIELPILHSRKVWQGESLVNHPWFAKLKPFELVLTINNLLADL